MDERDLTPPLWYVRLVVGAGPGFSINVPRTAPIADVVTAVRRAADALEAHEAEVQRRREIGASN